MTQLHIPAFPLSEPNRNQTQNCQTCNQPFTLIRRQHLCKRCYRFVCDACSPHKQKVYKANMHKRQHRLCNFCYTQSEILKKYVVVNKISWGQDSQISKSWVKHVRGLDQGRRETKGRIGKRGIKVEYSVNVGDLWASFNYSFRELIGRAIDNNKNLCQPTQKSQKQTPSAYSSITQQCLQLLSSAHSYNPSQNPINILYILIFFLIHCSPQNALLLTKQICHFVTDKEISIDNVIKYLQKLNFSEMEACKMDNYLEMYGNKIIKCITINCMSVQMSIQIVSMLVGKWNFYDLEKAIAYSLSKRKEYVVANASKPDLILIDLLRYHQGLGDGFKKFCKLFEDHEPSPHKNRQMGDKSRTPKNSPQSQSSPSKSATLQIPPQTVIKELEQLRIKYKNKEEELYRLQKQKQQLVKQNRKLKKNNNIAQTFERNSQERASYGNYDDIDSNGSCQSYWEEVEQENGGQEERGEGRKMKLVKRRRAKPRVKLERMSTKSQKIAHQISLFNRSPQASPEPTQLAQVMQQKNRQILHLQKHVQLLKYTSKLQQKQLKTHKQQTQYKDSREQQLQNMHKKQKEYTEQNKQLKNRLNICEDMNKKLVLKIKELTNLLMDRDEEIVKDQQISTSRLVEVYERNGNIDDQECAIF